MPVGHIYHRVFHEKVSWEHFALISRKGFFVVVCLFVLITVSSSQHVLFLCVYTTGGFVLIIPQTSNSNYGVTLIKIGIKIISQRISTIKVPLNPLAACPER